MGYAFIMFTILLLMAVVAVVVANYGIEKEGQVVQLKAEDAYAEREAGKAQTGLTIVETCLSDNSRYTSTIPGQTGPLKLHLTIKNNGSTILNPSKATVFYDNSYRAFTVSSGNNWLPLNNASLLISNVLINPLVGPEVRLLVAAENGIFAIAPTSPVNFTGRNYGNETFEFTWTASKDDKGIDYYLIYKYEVNPRTTCPQTPDGIFQVSGNMNNTYASIPCPPPCKNKYFFITAVDVDGNMGVQSRTVNCPGSANKPCDY